MRIDRLLTLGILLFCGYSVCGQTVAAGPLRVGAAKVDITPAESELPKQYLGILDHLYARAIFIDNGKTSAVMVALDSGVIPNPLWSDVSERIEKELGVPHENILISATHSHSAPMIGFTRGPNGTASFDNKPYEEKVFSAAKIAKQGLRPARVKFGTGVSYLNVQRDQIDPVTHRWWEGANYDGPSDKTVAVIAFEDPAGTPIAVYYNYAMHAVLTGNLDLVSSDYPGAASRYIENALGSNAVALFASGAAGDQNPIYFQQTYDLRAIRIKEYAKRGEDISNAMPPGGVGLDRSNPDVARLMNEQKQMSISMGQLLGEEVMHAMRTSGAPADDIRLLGKQNTVTCPGRERTNQGRGGLEGSYKEGPPVQIRLGLLMIGDIAVGTVNAEVYNLMARRLKKESPYAKTLMSTLTNGMANSGYIPDDASFGHQTFEVLSSRLQPGCAESAIVSGIIGMMPKSAF